MKMIANSQLHQLPPPPAAPFMQASPSGQSFLEIDAATNYQTQRHSNHSEFTDSIVNLASAAESFTLPPKFEVEYAFWRATLRFLSMWHGVMSCAYDLASNYRTFRLASTELARSRQMKWHFPTEEWTVEWFAARRELMVSLTNFGWGVSSCLPTLIVTYPQQLAAYRKHHNPAAPTMPRARERQLWWTWVWSSVYTVVAQNVGYNPTPMAHQEWKKHLGEMGGLKEVKYGGAAEIVNGTKLEPIAEGQRDARMEQGMLDSRLWSPDERYELQCSGGHYFGKISHLNSLAPFTTGVGALHNFATEKTQRIWRTNNSDRWRKIVRWLSKGSSDDGYFQGATCTHNVPREKVREYVLSQVARLKPHDPKLETPWDTIKDMNNDMWMIPRKEDMDAIMEADSNKDKQQRVAAPISRWPGYMIDAAYSGTLAYPGAFASMNPVATNMIPELTMMSGLVK